MNTTNTTEAYKLGDDVIAHIAKSLQLALLTGTDIVDNLRLIELNLTNNTLVLSQECAENFENNLSEMVENLPQKDSPFSS